MADDRHIENRCWSYNSAAHCPIFVTFCVEKQCFTFRLRFVFILVLYTFGTLSSVFFLFSCFLISYLVCDCYQYSLTVVSKRNMGDQLDETNFSCTLYTVADYSGEFMENE